MEKKLYKQICKIAAVEVLLQLGFEKCTDNSLDLITDVYIYYIEALCKSISGIDPIFHLSPLQNIKKYKDIKILSNSSYDRDKDIKILSNSSYGREDDIENIKTSLNTANPVNTSYDNYLFINNMSSSITMKLLISSFYSDCQFEIYELFNFIEFQLAMVKYINTKYNDNEEDENTNLINNNTPLNNKDGDSNTNNKNNKNSSSLKESSMLHILKLIPKNQKLKSLYKTVRASIVDQKIKNSFIREEKIENNMEVKETTETDEKDIFMSEYFNKFILKCENEFETITNKKKSNINGESDYKYDLSVAIESVISNGKGNGKRNENDGIERPIGLMVNKRMELNEEEQESIFDDFGPTKFKLNI